MAKVDVKFMKDAVEFDCVYVEKELKAEKYL